MAFKYDDAKRQIEGEKEISEIKHTCRIVKFRAMLNKNDAPMMIIEFKIEDDEDKDSGKTFPGFISLTADRFAMEQHDDFFKALGLDPRKEYANAGDDGVDVEWLAKWGEDLIGECLVVKSGYGKGERRNDPIAQGYFPLGANATVGDLLDLDDDLPS